MNEIMLSIRPKWCELIASGQKTIEIRKTKPKSDVPFKVYIYCTKPSKKYQTVSGCMVLNSDELFRLPTGEIKHGSSVEMMRYDNYTTDNFLNGKVIGEFVCDKIHSIHVPSDIRYCVDFGIWSPLSEKVLNDACLTAEEILDYAGNKEFIFGWHISDLVIYDKPKELSDFYKPCIYGEESDVSCFLCDKSGYRPDMYIDCFNKVTRPPQSWCYVEKERESNDE